MPEVFISYRHTDAEHSNQVRDFGERLRSRGVYVLLDQFVLEENPAGPNDGWDKWSSDCALETDFVLIVGSQAWFQCFEKKQRPGSGLGAACEADDIRHRIYDASGTNSSVRIVLFEDAEAEFIPGKLKRYHRFHAERDFDNIVCWLDGASRSKPSGDAAKQPRQDRGQADKKQSYISTECAEIQQARTELQIARFDGSESVRAKEEQLRTLLKKGRVAAHTPGDILDGNYRLLEIIGEGSFATVWRAVQLDAESEVAVKILHPHIQAKGGDYIDRFRSGNRQMLRLKHPALVRAITRVLGGNALYYVMEFFPSQPLDKMKDIDNDHAWQIVTSLADGLIYMHEERVCHRDINPSNVIVLNSGAARLTDFDLVKAPEDTHLTNTGLGTYHYSAPEQLTLDASTQDDIDFKQADIYSLAKTTYFVLTGMVPQPGNEDSDLAKLRKCASWLHPSAIDAIESAWNKDPNKRPSATKFREIWGGARKSRMRIAVFELAGALVSIFTFLWLHDKRLYERLFGGGISLEWVPVLLVCRISRPSIFISTCAAAIIAEIVVEYQRGAGNVIGVGQAFLDYGVTALAMMITGFATRSITFVMLVLVAYIIKLLGHTISGCAYFGLPWTVQGIIKSIEYNSGHVIPEMFATMAACAAFVGLLYIRSLRNRKS